jgi:hypothetical protein
MMPDTRSKTMTWKVVGHILVFVHGPDSPSDGEWDEAMVLFRAVPDVARIRVLVFTGGGAPDARQRAKLHTALGKTKATIAVLTPSALARAAGTAIAWFNPGLRVFDPDDIERAFDHLDAARAERPVLSRTLAELRREMHV